MVLVVDCGKQGLYEDNDGIADGVYTDNVVWKEALLHDDADALQSSAATSNEGPHATQSPAQPPTLQATTPALATAGQDQWSEGDTLMKVRARLQLLASVRLNSLWTATEQTT